MNDKKMTVCPPLAPIAENAKCKEQYEKLEAEFAEIDRLKVKDVDICISDDDTVVTLDEFNGRVEAYMQRRDAHNMEFAGDIETRDHVRENIKELKRQLESILDEEERLQKEYEEKWGDEIPDELDRFKEQMADEDKLSSLGRKSHSLLCRALLEERKFEDMKNSASELFAVVADHTRMNGTIEKELARMRNNLVARKKQLASSRNRLIDLKSALAYLM